MRLKSSRVKLRIQFNTFDTAMCLEPLSFFVFFLWSYLTNIIYKDAPESMFNSRVKLRMQFSKLIRPGAIWYSETCSKGVFRIWGVEVL